MFTLRSLDRRDRRLAALVAALLLVPYAAAVLRARSQGWVPSGDAGMIGLFARDVLHGSPPLIGSLTTASQQTHQVSHHPGPIEFYALALPMWALGPTTGMLLWTAFANAASILVAAWVAFRWLGRRLALWAAFLLGAIAWSQGPAALVDPINSDAGAIPLVALAVLAWAVACGDHRLLPLLALWSAYFCQLHLSYLPMGAALTAWALGALAIRTWGPSAWAAVRHRHEARWTATPVRRWPWLAGAAAVTVVAWLPVLVDTVTGDPSNARAIWTYSRATDRGAVGSVGGMRAVVQALSPRLLVLRTDLGPIDLLGQTSNLERFSAIGVGLALVATTAWWWRRRPGLAMLALTTLAFVPVGWLVAAQIPSLQLLRMGFFRWTAVLSALMAIALGGAAIELAHRLPVPRRPLFAEWTRLLGIALVATIAVGAATVAGPQRGREANAYRAERRIAAAVLPAVAGKANVFLVPYGSAALLSLTMPLALELESHGHHVTVAKLSAPSYGEGRKAGVREPDVVLVVAGALEERPATPGQLLIETSTDEVRRSARAELEVQARSAPVRVAPGGAALARQAGQNPDLFAYWMGGIAIDPASRLANPGAVRLLRDGYLSSPQLDRHLLDLLVDPPSTPTVWAQDTFRVTMLTPEEYRQAYGPIR